MPLLFTKMQGAGNDFIVVQGAEHDGSRLAPALCDRHFGIGADGLLVALPSEKAAVRMRMFNPDGTEDECGNGLRCLALYALRRGLVDTPEFTVETLCGIRSVRVEDWPGPKATVTTDLGRASLEAADVPARFPGRAIGVPLEVGGETLTVHSLSTGTAHTVIFETPDEARFQRLSPLIEHHPAFPERTSVLWTEVRSRDRARVRIWERGAGETLACGTGAAAVAVAAFVSGRTDPRVQVTSAGGTLTVDVSDSLDLRLTGPAAFVFEGAVLVPDPQKAAYV
jgi:diaminopimelate epimerase